MIAAAMCWRKSREEKREKEYWKRAGRELSDEQVQAVGVLEMSTIGIILGAVLFTAALVFFLRDARRQRERERKEFADEATEADRGSF
jgi:hypothetical protein